MRFLINKNPPATFSALLTAVTLLLSILSSPALAETSSPPDTFQNVDAYVDQQLNALKIPGAALGVVENGQVVHVKGFGHQVTPQTPLVMGSTSKAFTAMAIMQLVEQHKVDLDAPVKTYLPWFQLADPQASSTITIRNLLYHTAGIGTADDLAVFAKSDPAESLESLVRGLKTVPVQTPVGTKYEYSNAGYAVLGLVVEKVSGVPFAQYVQTHLFQPLQMKHSYTDLHEAEQHGMDGAFQPFFGWPVGVKEPLYYPAGLPNGYLIASTEDLSHFAIAAMNGGRYEGASLVTPQDMQALEAPAIQEAPGVFYGMGWNTETYRGMKMVQSNGDDPFFTTTVYTLPARGIGVVLMVNENNLISTPLAVREITLGVLDVLTGNTPTPAGSAYWQTYRLVDAVAIGVVVIGLFYLIWLVRRKKRPSGRRRFLRLLLPLLQIAISLVAWWAVPIFIPIPSWSYLFFLAPDLTSIILFVLATLFVGGVYQVARNTFMSKSGTISLKQKEERPT